MCVQNLKLKSGITENATATNEACKGRLPENRYLMGKGMTLLIAKDLNLLCKIFMMEDMSKFLAFG